MVKVGHVLELRDPLSFLLNCSLCDEKRISGGLTIPRRRGRHLKGNYCGFLLVYRDYVEGS